MTIPDQRAALAQDLAVLQEHIDSARVNKSAGIYIANRLASRIIEYFRSTAAAQTSDARDAARLDWLDKQRGDLVDRDPFTGDPQLLGHCWGVEGQTYNVRDAIDSAIAASGEAG